MTTVLITGANRGIGLALANTYAERGARVVATCRHPAKAGELQELARTTDGLVSVVELDVTDPASVTNAALSLEGEPLDILINNAGVNTPDRQSSLAMDFDGWAHAFAVNTMGPLRVVQEFLSSIRLARHAKVIAITSRMGSSTSASGDQLAYRTTKAALNRAMQGLASDLRRDDIVVAVMHPGWVRTQMGGRGAPLSPRDSAAGIANVIDGLTMSRTGSFIDIDGRTISW